MDAERFIERHWDKFGSPWEERFVRDVLSRVRNLDWGTVRPQRSFAKEGTTGYIDFAIEEGEHVRIAIEVHGYDKDGSGQLTREKFNKELDRALLVQDAGWYLINVPNGLVKDLPHKCARTIELVLKRERARAPAPGSQSAGAGQPLAPREETELDRLRTWMSTELRRLGEALEVEVQMREAAETHRDMIDKDRWGMLRLARYFAVIAVAMAAIVAIVVTATVRPAVQEDDAQAAVDPACNAAVHWTEAADLVGDHAEIRGRVVDATYQRGTEGSPTFLNIGRAFPASDRFDVVVWGRHRDAFPEPPEALYEGQEIVAEGRIEEYRGIPQMAIDSPAVIQMC